MPESEAVLLDVLASYVPAFIKRHLLDDPKPLTEPRIEAFSGAVLFVDITGFTDLAEALAKQSVAGAEELSYLLNVYIEELVDLITLHGGDIVKFAGDALVALWAAGVTDDDLATITHRSAQCGLLIQAMLHDQQPLEKVRLSLRVGIGAGTVTATHVGGSLERWEVLIAGDPLVQMGRAEKVANAGQVVLSPEAWYLLRNQCQGQQLEDGHAVVHDVYAPLEHRLEPPLQMPELATDALKHYIPGAILSRLTAKQTDWLAELRRVTVLFVNLPDLNHTTPVDRVQQVMKALQTALYRYEGSINKLSADDKGASLLAALGLHPLSHEDDPKRGIQAALAIQKALRNLGVQGSIGVATGRTFCGVVGSQRRREYTLISKAVNLAARLMQIAPDYITDEIPILADEETYNATKRDINFEKLAPVFVKGKSDITPIYRPISQKRRDIFAQTRPENQPKLIGREAEIAALLQDLQLLKQGGRGGLYIIEGEVGIGKSRLLEEIFYTGQEMGLTCFVGSGSAIEKGAAYAGWHSIVRQIFGLEAISKAEIATRITAVAQQLLPLTEQAYIPLFNDILPLNLAENEVTQTLSRQVRAQKTRLLLVTLLQKMALIPSQSEATTSGDSFPAGPMLIILEDAHWLDSASWSLISAIHLQVHPLLFVLATRPMADSQPEELKRLLSLADTKHQRLDLLSAKDALLVAQQRLGVSNFPEPVADLIVRKAEGHPFFSEEFARNLHDRGILQIEGGECWLSRDIGSLEELDFPHTIRGVITSRIDRLKPEHQLMLKVASVVGRIFPFQVLHDIYPVERDKAFLADYIRVLDQLDITRLESAEPDLAYIFKHISTREVAYDLLLFSQRRQLHQAVAEWYENACAGNLEQYYALLAHHWSNAVGNNPGQTPLGLSKPEVIETAVHYLVKAGDQALRTYANQEAIAFFRRALACLHIFPETPHIVQQEIAIIIKLAPPLIATKGYADSEVSQIYTRACTLCQEFDGTDALYVVLQGLLGLYFSRADLQTARELAEHLQSWAVDKQDLLLQIKAGSDLGHILMLLGEFKPAQHYLDNAVNLYENRYQPQGRDSLYQGVNPGIDAYAYTALNLWILGQTDQAQTMVESGLALAQMLFNPLNQAAMYGYTAMFYQFRQNRQLVLAYAEKLIELANQHQFAFWGAWGKIMQAWALADFTSINSANTFSKGIGRLREGLGDHSATGAALYRSYFLTMLAEMIGQSGRIDTALHLLDNLLAGVAEYDERFYVVEVLRVKGELLAQYASLDEAISYFERAVHMAHCQSANALALRAQASLDYWTKHQST